jgi:hypothetical protein
MIDRLSYDSSIEWDNQWIEMNKRLFDRLSDSDVWGSGCIDERFLDFDTRRDGGAWSVLRPYPREKWLWTTWRSENSWTNLDSNSDPFVVHPVASRYTDWALQSLWLRTDWQNVVDLSKKWTASVFAVEGKALQAERLILSFKTIHKPFKNMAELTRMRIIVRLEIRFTSELGGATR